MGMKGEKNMNTKGLIEAAKFQATVKPHDEFIVEVAERLETLYEQNNNQKAEIERYEKESDEKFNKWKLLDDRTKQRYAELYEEAKSVVRAEAVKEFAEKVKMAFYYEFDEIIPSIMADKIDNLVKEMAGDTE